MAVLSIQRAEKIGIFPPERSYSMSKFLTRSSSFIHYLPREMQSVYELDQDSFFYRAFKANEKTACEVVKTQYLQTMKVGNLNPNYYGGLTVLDSYYCYRASDTLKSLLCNIDKAADKVMYVLTDGMISGYDDYNSTFLKDWHIREPDTKVYFEASKKSIDIEPPLAQGASVVEGDGLKLQISSSGKDELQTWHNMSDISSASGDSVGEVFTLAGEDYTDSDYNDVYVSLSAWDKSR